MAELVLKIGVGSGYQDGDICCAFNRRRIRCCHADAICHVRHVEFNKDGLNPPDSLPTHWFENTYQYRFDRVSPTEVLRTNLWTSETDLLSNVPNQNGDRIDVVAYLARRLNHPLHRIFGTAGNEFWYGGEQDLSHESLDAVWQKIEELTPKREGDHTLAPLTATEKKHFLSLPVEEFTDTARVTYESSLIQDEVVVQKRIHKVEYAALVDAGTLVKVQDLSQEVDVRETLTPLRSPLIVRTKAALIAEEL